MALREGSPVPPDVLADYPDLAAKYPMPTTTGRQIQQADLPNGNITRTELAANNPRGAEALRLAEEAPPARPPVEPPAPPAGPPPVDPAFAGNIRLSKYDPDVKQIVLDAHAAGAGDLQATRRGVMSAEELNSLAAQAGTKVSNLVKTWEPGTAANAETLFALRQTLAGQSSRILNAQKTYAAVDSSDNLVALTEELARQKTIQDVVAGVTSEAGRGLWQFTRKVEGTDAEARIGQFLKLTGNRFTAEELGGVMKGVDFENPIAVAKTTRELFVPAIKDKVTALWYFNLLSAPTTHIKNTVSNVVTLAGKPIEAAIAAPIDVARVGIGRALGKDVQRERFAGEASANVAGMLASVQEGALSALQIMRYGYTKSEAAAKIDIGMREAFTGPVGAVVNIPGRSLRASDVFFRSMNKTAEIYGQAFRIAKQEGKTGQALADRVVELRTNPLPEMVKAAEKEGAYRVFQQDGQFINAATGFRNKIPALRVVVPFIQTPYNITKYILERSPLGYAGVAADAAGGKLASGGNLSDRLARASMGGTLFAALYV
ncbi:MAG TPA: hypothetical protein VFD42_05460, partial [Chloroflexota bacterium]|nr:hypothetical protein [Chloroflexota bacterium]